MRLSKQSVLKGVAILTFGAVLGVGLDRLVTAQAELFKRTPLQKVDDPGAANYDVVMGSADVLPGGTSGMHWHHGLEASYVIDGEIVVQVEGQPDRTVKAGEPFKIDPTKHHNAINKSSKPTKILAVYIVEKGKPLAEAVK
jgi:quercetin dioxygenase-like cupin family protein